MINVCITVDFMCKNAHKQILLNLKYFNSYFFYINFILFYLCIHVFFNPKRNVEATFVDLLIDFEITTLQFEDLYLCYSLIYWKIIEQSNLDSYKESSQGAF